MKHPLHDDRQLALRPLPPEAAALLTQAAAPPRLIAHVRLVHHVAAQILEQLHQHGLLPSLDREAVLFGAATHDIGKATVRIELTGPGNLHEHQGRVWLERHGVEIVRARFAETHGAWQTLAAHNLEDLLVVLADTCWKGKREAQLEQHITDMLTKETQRDPWNVWLTLDTMIESIAADADTRLLWQAQFSAL